MLQVCFGDGSDGGVCPCNNIPAAGSGQGCVNSSGVGGLMIGTGSSSAASDDLVLHVSQCRPNKFGMFVQGTVAINISFKDGLLCMGNPTERLGFILLDGMGAGGSSGLSIVTEGNVSARTTLYYQFWFRDGDGLSVCGENSNLTNGLQVDWL